MIDNWFFFSSFKGGFMTYEGVVVQFQGFHPSDYTQSHLDAILSEIQTESPQGSKLRVTLQRHNKDLKAIVRITSSAGTFFATTTGHGLRRVCRELTQQIRRQLAKHKHRRHLRRSLRQVSFQTVPTEEFSTQEAQTIEDAQLLYQP
jgi:hypothetical protein